MRYLWVVLLCCCATQAAERFKINTVTIRQILADNKALVVFKDELVLLVGLDFSKSGDGESVRSSLHGHWDGNYRYSTVLGATKTVRKITVEE